VHIVGVISKVSEQKELEERRWFNLDAKIKVSYTDPEDLHEVVKLLQPVLRNVKVAHNDQGKYKKAYIELRTKI
jgi:hypothetical protein